MSSNLLHLINQKLRINKHEEIAVNANKLKTVIISEDVKLLPGSVYFTHSQELIQAINPSILLSAPTWSDIQRLTMEIYISNDNVDFHKLHHTHSTARTADKSQQLYVEGFKFKYFKIRLENTDISEEAIKSLSYSY
tara:strand:+ start:2312 stop:2722 length:411 start_codon:yes stop_codon:yes gene_type:complete